MQCGTVGGDQFNCQWYGNSQKCSVYLIDVDESTLPTEQDLSRFRKAEFIDPTTLECFSQRWESTGKKRDLTTASKDIMRILEGLKDKRILGSINSGERPLIARIMWWAADRTTTRVEDRAYSLLGILYEYANTAISDHNMFAWNPRGRLESSQNVLADNPNCFRGCHDIESLRPKEFVAELREYIHR
ncbi:hypothetical protein BKA82DRAFT_25193 [Pisolithus tinctorius]|uniref:Uncharacterized protein n=1 Tax=Pisolithus tinctorius Marx 270 TaxID=870435 RepID=A0A0C3NYQ7_PISTI|nr:hypothetical protein BKA82DRAFT_25193 [Pisolithus tinctorius]KIO05950.1 hypothetical protein M404DRAFT_25193 [Pisolithus tinctorius Marx 270]